jgi:hypothetical protein
VLVHHTATPNGDSDPEARLRRIYRFHATARGWGDIGYNFAIDEQGRVFEGRHSGAAHDSSGQAVAGAHAKGYNAGTVGIALLGSLVDEDATPAAHRSAAELIAAILGPLGIDPDGSAPYVNPVSGVTAVFPNIAGHCDVGDTPCPGAALHASLPAMRHAVARLIGR